MPSAYADVPYNTPSKLDLLWAAFQQNKMPKDSKLQGKSLGEAVFGYPGEHGPANPDRAWKERGDAFDTLKRFNEGTNPDGSPMGDGERMLSLLSAPTGGMGRGVMAAKAPVGAVASHVDRAARVINSADNYQLPPIGHNGGPKMYEGSVRDVERLRDAGFGTANTFLDDIARDGLEGAVKTRFNYFKNKEQQQAGLLAKAQDPSNKVSGIKPSYAGTFGGEKTLPLSKTDAYDKGLSVVDHPLAGSATRRPLTVNDLVGKTATVLAGDQARVAQINKVLGQDVGGIHSLGGRDNARFGQGWQSDSKKIDRLEEIIADTPDESVLGALPPMGGAAHDFQHTMSEILTTMADPKSTPKKYATPIDALINPTKEKGGNKFRDYPGIRSEDFSEWFLKQSNTARSGIIKALTTTPKAFADDFPRGMAPYEMIPGFDIPAARHAMTEPDLINKVFHNTDPSVRDFNFFEPNAKKSHTSQTAVPHPSFVDALPGGIYGRMADDAELPMSLLFDDYFVGAGKLGQLREKTGLQKSAAGSIAQNMPMRSPEGSGLLGLGEPRARITPAKAEDISDYYRIWDSFK